MIKYFYAVFVYPYGHSKFRLTLSIKTSPKKPAFFFPSVLNMAPAFSKYMMLIWNAWDKVFILPEYLPPAHLPEYLPPSHKPLQATLYRGPGILFIWSGSVSDGGG